MTEKGLIVQKFKHDDVEIIERTAERRGFLSIFRYTLRHKLFAGGWSHVFQRELMERGHAAVVIPYDPQRDSLVLLEQFRVGAMSDETSPWLLEFVAGMIDASDTDAEAVAHRELFEEAGLKAQAMHYALTYYSSPGGCTEKISIFLAEVDSSKAATLGGLATEHEDIRVHVLPRVAVEQLLAQGKINNAASVIGLQWLQLHRTSLFSS